MIKRLAFSTMAIAFTLPTQALAYIGPGAGLGMLGALWGLLVAVGAALLFVLLWPIRRAIRRRNGLQQADESTATEPVTDTPSAPAHDARRH